MPSQKSGGWLRGADLVEGVGDRLGVAAQLDGLELGGRRVSPDPPSRSATQARMSSAIDRVALPGRLTGPQSPDWQRRREPVAATTLAVEGADHDQVAARRRRARGRTDETGAPAGVVVEGDRVGAVSRRAAVGGPVHEQGAVERRDEPRVGDVELHAGPGAHVEGVAMELEVLADLAAHLAAELERTEDRDPVGDVGLAPAGRGLERQPLSAQPTQRRRTTEGRRSMGVVV